MSKQYYNKKNNWKKYNRNQSNDSIMKFAKALAKQMVVNSKNVKAKNAVTYSTYTKENIIKWLQSPASNEKNLRNASNYMYVASMHYQRLISYYAGLFEWAFVISPLNFNKTKVKDEKFRNQYQKVADALELMNIPETMHTIMTVVLREGAYYGVRWADGNSSFCQKIDADYCTITSISDGTFLYSVDMSQIKEDKLGFYPSIFTTMYNNYKTTGEKLQEVPADVSVCIKADPSVIDYTVPPFAATMPSLYTIANTEALQETADELNNYKMLSGKVPVDANGQPLIPWDIVEKYYTNLCNAVGDKVGVAVTPFDLKDFNFEASGGLADVDNVNRAISNYWTTAGTSGLLHGVSNDTAGVTKLAIKNDESYLAGMVKQAERMFNRYLKNNFNGTIKFKITFLPITIFNKEEYIKMYKESVPFGVGKIYYLAALGIHQFDVEGLSYIEDNIIKLKEILTPMVNSHNSSSETLEDSGRPQEEDEDLSESGEATRDADANSNR